MRMRFDTRLLAVFVGLLLVSAATGAEKGKRVFMAGAATSNITPWLGEGIVGGWSAPPAKHVHDDLHARCLVLDDGTTRIAIVLADSVSIPREVFDEAKRQINEHTGLTMDRMLMAATHTHSSVNSRWKNILVPNQKFCEYQTFLAHRIADGVRRAINNLEPARLAWHDWVALGMRQRELELAVRKPTPEQVVRAKELLAQPELPDKLPHERNYAERVLQQQEAPATIRVIVQAVRIGDLGIATSPFETFTEMGLEIKARSPLRPAFTIELANGGYGYLPTAGQHELGGYETWLGTSKVEPQASVKLVAALLEMLGELKRAADEPKQR